MELRNVGIIGFNFTYIQQKTCKLACNIVNHIFKSIVVVYDTQILSGGAPFQTSGIVIS